MPPKKFGLLGDCCDVFFAILYDMYFSLLIVLHLRSWAWDEIPDVFVSRDTCYVIDFYILMFLVLIILYDGRKGCGCHSVFIVRVIGRYSVWGLIAYL